MRFSEPPEGALRNGANLQVHGVAVSADPLDPTSPLITNLTFGASSGRLAIRGGPCSVLSCPVSLEHVRPCAYVARRRGAQARMLPFGPSRGTPNTRRTLFSI